jgi:WD40 repeat protein
VFAWDPMTERTERLVAASDFTRLAGVITVHGRDYLLLQGENARGIAAWIPGANAPCREPWTRALAAFGESDHVNWDHDIFLSPDGQMIAGVSAPGQNTGWAEAGLTVTTLEDPPVARRLLGHQGILYNCAFSPDSRHVAAGSADSTVRLWDLSTPSACLATFRGHRMPVTHQEFTADGRTLVTSCFDMVRFWNVASGQEMLVLPGRPVGPRERRELWRWFIPPDSADGLLLIPPTNPPEVQFFPVRSMVEIDEEIRRQADARGKSASPPPR